MSKPSNTKTIFSAKVDKPLPAVGAFLRHLRSKFGLTQEYIAIKIGVSRPTLNKIENGKAEISLLQAKKLADFYNLPLQNLLTGEDALQNQVRQALNTNGADAASPAPETRPEFRMEIGTELILFICSRLMAEPQFGEVNLKLLLFVLEITAVKKLNYPFPGFVFLKTENGPEPENWSALINSLIHEGKLVRLNQPQFKYPHVKYLPLRPVRLELFKASEIRLVEEINLTAGQLDLEDLQELVGKIELYSQTKLFNVVKLI